MFFECLHQKALPILSASGTGPSLDVLQQLCEHLARTRTPDEILLVNHVRII